MRPVCDVNRGQTFHSMCHAMNCGGREERDMEMGACSERVSKGKGREWSEEGERARKGEGGREDKISLLSVG